MVSKSAIITRYMMENYEDNMVDGELNLTLLAEDAANNSGLSWSEELEELCTEAAYTVACRLGLE
jgi:hypothetical protein